MFDPARSSIEDLLSASAEEQLQQAVHGESLRRRADELFAIWGAARAEASVAYDDWCNEPGPRAYVAYRAAEDRADAAEFALAATWAGRRADYVVRAA